LGGHRDDRWPFFVGVAQGLRGVCA
jgi:hypothetical protein